MRSRKSISILAIVLAASLIGGVSASIVSISVAQVFVVDQFADMEVSASATCPGEVWPEADFQKRWLTDLDAVSETLTAEMTSDCSTVSMRSYLSVNYGADFISTNYGSISGLDSLAGGYAQLTSFIRIRVETPTQYTLFSDGEFLEIRSTDMGGHGFRFAGGTIEHDSNGAVIWDEEWQGTLQPGVEYTLYMQSSSSRGARELPGEDIITNDGDTLQDVTFHMIFDAVVVGSDAPSWGSLKARY